MTTKFLTLALSAIICTAVIGCSSGSGTATVTAPPAKPLSSAEEAILKQLEDTPAGKRGNFMTKNMAPIMHYAQQNKTFQDRLNGIAKETKSGK